MRVSTVSMACILLLPALAAAAERDLASPNSDVPRLAWISHVAGSCWRSELAKGETYDRQCFSVQFGKVVRAEQTIESLKAGKVVSTLNASSVYAWDPRQQKIRHIFWGSDGSFESATGWIEDVSRTCAG